MAVDIEEQHEKIYCRPMTQPIPEDLPAAIWQMLLPMLVLLV